MAYQSIVFIHHHSKERIVFENIRLLYEVEETIYLIVMLYKSYIQQKYFIYYSKEKGICF